jgi:hypothetical protein
MTGLLPLPTATTQQELSRRVDNYLGTIKRYRNKPAEEYALARFMWFWHYFGNEELTLDDDMLTVYHCHDGCCKVTVDMQDVCDAVAELLDISEVIK